MRGRFLVKRSKREELTSSSEEEEVAEETGSSGRRRRRKSRQDETPEEAALRRARDRERAKARRAKMKESMSPIALAEIRAKNYESALKKRYQNDDKPYTGPDAVPGETVGDRRRRLEAQRVRERRRLKKLNQGQQDKGQEGHAKRQRQSQVKSDLLDPKMRNRLRHKILDSIHKSIQTSEEAQLISDVKWGKFRPPKKSSSSPGDAPTSDLNPMTSTLMTLSPAEEEEGAFKRLLLAQLDSDFFIQKRNLVSTALELELGPTIPVVGDESGSSQSAHSTPVLDKVIVGGQDKSKSDKKRPQTGRDSLDDNVVVKIEPESDEETVQDWLARMYSSETEEEEHEEARPTCPTTPTPAQLLEYQTKISQLKDKCSQRARAKELSRLQTLLEGARGHWIESASTPDDDLTRIRVDQEREALIERVYSQKRSLIAAAEARLGQKREECSQETEEERKSRVQAAIKALQQEDAKVKPKVTKKVTTPELVLVPSTSPPQEETMTPGPPPPKVKRSSSSRPPGPLDSTARATMAEKARIRSKMGKAEHSLFSSLLDTLTCYPLDTEEGLIAASFEFESLLTSSDHPRLIQFWALVRTTKDKYPDVVHSYRKLLHNFLSIRIQGLLSRPTGHRRVATFTILPLYKQLYPEGPEPLAPVQEPLPVSREQSLRDFHELKAFISGCPGGPEALGEHLRPKKSSSAVGGNWSRIKADPARHEHMKALKRRWHQRKKNGVEVELGAYLTVASGKGRRMLGMKGRKEDPAEDTPPKKKRAPKTKKVPRDPTLPRRTRGPGKKNKDGNPVKRQARVSKKNSGYGQFIPETQLGQPYSGMGDPYSAGSSVHGQSQSQGQDMDDDDYELGWLPMGSGVQLSGLLSSQQNPNQALHPGSNYTQLQSHPSSSSSNRHQPHPQFYQDPAHHHLLQQQQQQQQAVWNLSHNQPQNIQLLTNSIYPTSHLGWANPYSQGQSQGHDHDDDPGSPQEMYAPDDDRDQSSDSGGESYFPSSSFSQLHRPRSGGGRGRPRKERKRKSTSTQGQGPRKRKSTPVLLAVDAQLPPLLRLDNVVDYSAIPSEPSAGMDPCMIESILPKCPHCNDVLIGPVELEKHVKKMHPPNPPPVVESTEPTPVPPPTQKPNNRSTIGGGPGGDLGLKFDCPTCPIQFDSPVLLLSHIFMSHYPGKRYRCPFGRRIGDKMKESSAGAVLVTSGGRRCAKEDARYDRHGLRVHLPLVHPEEIRGTWILGINAVRVVGKASKFLCLKCDATTPTYSELLTHYTSSHGGVRYGCEFCGILLREDDHWMDHVQIFHPEKSCPALPSPVQIDQMKVFSCRICVSEFSSQDSLSAHSSKWHSSGETRPRDKKSTKNKSRSNENETEGQNDSQEQEEDQEEDKDGDQDANDQNFEAAPYKCEMCRRSYLSLGSLRFHSTQRHNLHKHWANSNCKIMQEKGQPVKAVITEGQGQGQGQGGVTAISTPETKPSSVDVDANPNSQPEADHPYSCHLCPFSTPSSASFHALHLGYDTYTSRVCSLCSKSFAAPYLLAHHLESDHGMDAATRKTALAPPHPSGKLGGVRPKGLYPEQWLSCGLCSRGFTHPEFHSIHTHFQEGKGALVCKTCHSLFPSRYMLRKHVKEDGCGSIATRASVSKVNPSPGQATTQKRVLGEEDIAKLTIATEVTTSSGRNTLHTCKVCLKSWKTAAFIRAHILEAHQEDAYTRVYCTQCQSTFSCRDNLRKHEKVMHSDQRIRFRCPDCPAVFQRMHKLKKHSKVEHPAHAFSIKDVTTFRAEEDDEPQLPAAGAAPQLRCDICSATFTTKVAMKRHVTQQHFSIHINTFCEGCGLQLHPSGMAAHLQKCKVAGADRASGTQRKSEAVSKSGAEKGLSAAQVLENVTEIYEKMEQLGLIRREKQSLKQKVTVKVNAKITKDKAKPRRERRVKVKKTNSTPRTIRNNSSKKATPTKGRRSSNKSLAFAESETASESEDSFSDNSSQDEDTNIARLSISQGHETRTRKTRSSSRLGQRSNSNLSSRKGRSAGVSGLDKTSSQPAAAAEGTEDADMDCDWNDMIIKQEASDVSDFDQEQDLDDYSTERGETGVVFPDEEEIERDLTENPLLLLWSETSSSSEEMEDKTKKPSKRSGGAAAAKKRNETDNPKKGGIPCRELKLVLQRCDDEPHPRN